MRTNLVIKKEDWAKCFDIKCKSCGNVMRGVRSEKARVYCYSCNGRAKYAKD